LTDSPRTLRITRLAAGGDGLGRLDDGRVVFVEGGVPGDFVELEDLRLGKRMAKARIRRVLEPSPDRTLPRCRHFGSCGGCSWQHIRYAAQLEAKREIVRDALERIGGVELASEIEILGSPLAYAYRARARLIEGDPGIGYRRRGSRECEAIEECPILLPSAEAALKRLIGDRRTRPAARPGSRSGKRRRTEPEWEILAGLNEDEPACTHRVGERTTADASIRIEVLGESLRARAGSFVQGNALLWNGLAEEVRRQCLAADSNRGSDAASAPRFVELYAGIGFLTLPLARAGWRGVVYESGRDALRDLAANLENGGFADAIEIVAGRVEGHSDWPRRLADAELLLVDPPRVGLESSLCESIAAVGPRRVVYVSCDPATLARDLRILLAGGYRIAQLRALDLFPQTAHVEVVARLERLEERPR
jgi:23S rRNA (uracil1939-C5)-methyltransferase